MALPDRDAAVARRLGAAVGAAAAVALAFAGEAAARGRAEPCPAARYVVGDAGGGDLVPGGATIEIGPHVTLGTACPGTASRRLRATRKGVTTVRARWKGCEGLAGRVRLLGRIVDGCTRFAGTVRARGRRAPLVASRSECGEGILDGGAPAAPYTPAPASLAAHPLPPWYDDAKFGVMIHWGIFAVPAWAETVVDPAEWLADFGRLLEPPDYGREWFAHIPYTEWYPNTILIEGSPARAHHQATYGADFAYESFRPIFEAGLDAWSPAGWADLFREAGARYVVLVTKHHDGFALWPSAVPHPTRPGWHAARDVVGDLTAAVRRNCMRMGLYYSGGLDWSVQPGPIVTSLDLVTVAPQGPAYVAYANAQWRELIARYRPAVLWNDLGYPNGADLLALFADYYNAVPDGVINDRFTIIPAGVHHDYRTTEFFVPEEISEARFETVRGMGRGFGYNQNESDADLDSADALVRLLVDVVSKNGNLLLNVGPLADGTIPAAQAERLRAIGRWLGVNGEAIFGTRPWVRATGTTGSGLPVRFTASADGRTVFAIVLGPLARGPLTITGFGSRPAAVRLLGAQAKPRWKAQGGDLVVQLRRAPAPQPAHVFAVRL